MIEWIVRSKWRFWTAYIIAWLFLIAWSLPTIILFR